MKTLSKHLNNLLICVFIFSFFGCDQNKVTQENEDKIIVSIGQLKLTEQELNSLSLKGENKLKLRQELVKNWINREILFKQAVADSIIYLDEYKELVEQSKKELAVALYMQKALGNFSANINESDIEQFYEDHSEEFRLTDRSYFINRVDFDSYEKAKEFRKNVFKVGWKSAVREYSGVIENNISEKLLSEYLITPMKLQRLVKNLFNGEVSIILKTEPNRYSVVQLIRKFYKNQIPEVKYINEKVKKRLIMIEKKKFIDELINDLYIKYKVELFEDDI